MEIGKVEKGMPVPENKPSYPIKELKVGDSFFCKLDNGEDCKKMKDRIAGSVYALARSLNLKVRIRQENDAKGIPTGVRVWRVK